MTTLRITGAVCAASLAAFAIFAYFPHQKAAASEIDRAAADAVAQCSSAAEKDLCYEKVVPAFMDKGFTMEQAFAITEKVQVLDPSYTYCHVLAHNISAKETAKDPSKWKDVVARAPYGFCGNGGSHGAFQERFREESMPNATVGEILRVIDGVCDDRAAWHPSRSQLSNCVHGVGHLAMYITGGDVQKSNAVCTEFAKHIPSPSDVQTCYEGVFMQVFQPIEPEDKALVETFAPKPAEARAYCEGFKGLVRSICIRESWILNADALTDPAVFREQCAPISDEAQKTYCIEGVAMGVFSRSYNFDSVRMMPLCEKLDAPTRAICISSVAFRILQTDWRNMDKALQVCAHADGSDRDACYRRLIGYGHSTFAADAPESAKLCGGMPEPWKDQCTSP